MTLNELISHQTKMDISHGFPVNFSSERQKFDQLTKDLVGLFGEIGEFSNIVKKINIKLDRPEIYKFDLELEKVLNEELVDSLIYILRISAILQIDLEAELLKKMQFNATRYEYLKEK